MSVGMTPPSDPFQTTSEQWVRMIGEDPKRAINNEYHLVHALCATEDCKEYADAWLETKNYVLSFGVLKGGPHKGSLVNNLMEKREFYKFRNVILDLHYDWNLALKLAAMHGHIGPWDARILAQPFISGRKKSLIVTPRG